MLLKLFLLLLLPYFAFAQQTIDVTKDNAGPVRDGLFYTVGGTPFSPYKYVQVVSGSPYFNDDWIKGRVQIAGGGQAKSDHVKLDLLSGDLLYKDSANNELIATTPITQLTLTDPANGKDYVFINSSYLNLPGTEAGWYMVLESGTATLFKKIKKTISESRPFNSATTEQTINTNNHYFIVFGNSIAPVKKPKDLLSVLSDKKDQLDTFINEKKLSGKNESDFLDVVVYYNSLSGSNK